MDSQFVRRSVYLLVCTLLLIVTMGLMANFNVQTAQASNQVGGGAPIPLYQLISAQITADATFTIYPMAKIANIGSYIVYSHTSTTNYYVTRLGTDHICIVKGSDVVKVPLCLPFSNIAGISYH